jgi:hypothetical protein
MSIVANTRAPNDPQWNAPGKALPSSSIAIEVTRTRSSRILDAGTS